MGFRVDPGHYTAGLTHKDRQLFTVLLTDMSNLQSPVSLTCMSLDCRKKLEHLEVTNTGTGRTHSNSKQKGSGRAARSNPESCCEAKGGTILTLCKKVFPKIESSQANRAFGIY